MIISTKSRAGGARRAVRCKRLRKGRVLEKEEA